MLQNCPTFSEDLAPPILVASGVAVVMLPTLPPLLADQHRKTLLDTHKLVYKQSAASTIELMREIDN